MANTAQHYRESGSFDAIGLVYMALGGLVSGLVGGVLYGVWSAYVPIIILAWVGTFGAPVVVGTTVGALGSFGHVRNAALVGVAGLLAGLVLLYATWVAWIWANFPPREEGDTRVLAAAPSELWSLVVILAGKYEFSIGKGGSGGLPVSGLFLQILWVIEAAILVLVPAGMAWSQVADEPYCEPCHKWIPVGGSIHKAMVGTIDEQKAALATGRVEGLYDLQGVSDTAPISLLLELRRCAGCSKRHYLTAQHVVRSVDDKGAVSFDKTPLATNMEIPAADYQGLLDGKKPDQAQAAI